MEMNLFSELLSYYKIILNEYQPMPYVTTLIRENVHDRSAGEHVIIFKSTS